jgi:predicted SnoaL-like aldol condensation-catalyzing enzyme
MTHRPALDRLIGFFETLSQDHVGALADLYSADAYFKDPFNEVRGHAAIVSIFKHMYKQVYDPRFEIRQSILEGDDAFILWDFHFLMKNKAGPEQCIHGSSHLRFTPDHKVDYHRDYWDRAEELYEKIPGLGWLMRLLRRAARYREDVP